MGELIGRQVVGNWDNLLFYVADMVIVVLVC